MTSVFERVSEMNVAFGNPRGNYEDFDVRRVLSQCVNIVHEYVELLKAFGVNEADVDSIVKANDDVVLFISNRLNGPDFDVLAARDALCDIQVFLQGAQHLMGVNGDDDMHAVLDGVMTRFIKNDEDKEATVKKHAAKGVKAVYFEGDYPNMVMKSAKDQPDAPKGKFLKSASFSEPVFPDPVLGELLGRVIPPFDQYRRREILKNYKLTHVNDVWSGGRRAAQSFVIEDKNGLHLAYHAYVTGQQ